MIFLYGRDLNNVLTFLLRLRPITFQDAVLFDSLVLNFFGVTERLHLILYRGRKLHRMKIIHTNGTACVLSGVSA